MKNLIITIGAVILILTVMQYQFELNTLLRQKQNLKFTADEAAATAALCYDVESFGQGIMVFNQKEARRKAGEIIRLNLKKDAEDASWEISFSEGQRNRPQVKVVIRQGKLTVTSKYEQVPFGIVN